MAQHLAGKVARLIGDFRTINALVNLSEHEMEKRIIARHGLVKLDALLNLLPRYKNEIRKQDYAGVSAPVQHLEDLITRLRNDYHAGELEVGRDAMAAHALKLDLLRIVATWRFMGATTFGVLLSDLDEIESELARVARNHVPAGSAHVDVAWQANWRRVLGPPDKPRYATIYPGLGTAGIVSPLPGGDHAQDTLIRAVGLATFLRQMRLLLDATPRNSTAERIFAEIMLNDYMALWEILFDSNVTNEHGAPDKCVLDHWNDDGWGGAACLSGLKANPHPDFAKWKEVRNKFTAHVDADEDVWKADVAKWPFTVDELINEARRVIEAFRGCGMEDIRAKIFFIPPSHFGSEVIGLAAQKGRSWAEN